MSVFHFYATRVRKSEIIFEYMKSKTNSVGLIKEKVISVIDFQVRNSTPRTLNPLTCEGIVCPLLRYFCKKIENHVRTDVASC